MCFGCSVLGIVEHPENEVYLNRLCMLDAFWGVCVRSVACLCVCARFFSMLVLDFFLFRRLLTIRVQIIFDCRRNIKYKPFALKSFIPSSYQWEQQQQKKKCRKRERKKERKHMTKIPVKGTFHAVERSSKTGSMLERILQTKCELWGCELRVPMPLLLFIQYLLLFCSYPSSVWNIIHELSYVCVCVWCVINLTVSDRGTERETETGWILLFFRFNFFNFSLCENVMLFFIWIHGRQMFH